MAEQKECNESDAVRELIRASKEKAGFRIITLRETAPRPSLGSQ